LSISGRENPSPSVTKVLLNPIPGRKAFTALVEPVLRLSTEIAATSIQHNLSDGRGMNERTFDSTREQRIISPEPQSPLFPKPNVPSPSDMLTNESRRTNQPSQISPTPQYLRPHKKASSDIHVKRQSEPRHNRKVSSPQPDEVFSGENVAMLETIVMGKR
jgi:hypothetical protein